MAPTPTDGGAQVPKRRFWSQPGLIVLLVPACATLLLHLLAVKGYGLNGDELYYLACSDHLDWGYVDQPPLSLALLHAMRVAFGDSLLSIRFLPALAGFFTVLLTGGLARRVGAGVFGQLLAQACVLVAPIFLALGHMYSMNAFDAVFWLAALYVVVLILDGGDPRLWLVVGLIVGVGLQNKISLLFLGFGLFIGFLLTSHRKQLLTRWLWLGALVAMAIFLPHLAWQVTHGWPTLAWMHNARTMKMASLSLPAFVGEQVVLMQPMTLPIWAAGFVALLVHPALKPYRPLGWCYVAILGLFVVQGAKPYYLAPFYPVLFATGSMAIERWLTRPWLRASVALILVGGGLVTAPLGMPLLPVETFINYSEAIGIRPQSGERFKEGRLPSFYANMFGWKELVGVVDAVFRSLPPEDRATAGIFCQNYMQAGAVDFYGREFGLPPAASGHNSYWWWGLGGRSGDVMVVVGGEAESLRQVYEEVVERARFANDYIQPIHSNIAVFVVRRPKVPLTTVWPAVKKYI
jgi:hypothetical protein